MIWRQKQKGGNGSTNIQAQVVQCGVSYDDAKSIAMDVFIDNFAKLSQTAHRLAIERADEFTENYLSELHEREPAAVENIEDPGIQSDILEAQAGFARSGDRDLGEVLVDILVDRTARTERTTASLALSAAINTAQKLTGPHFAALSTLFVFKQLRIKEVTDPQSLYRRMSICLTPMREDMARLSNSDIHYLTALGCITAPMGSPPIHQTLHQTYPGLFYEGIDISLAPKRFSGAPEDGPESVVAKFKDTPAVAPSFRDPTKFQIAAVDHSALKRIITENGLQEHGSYLERALTARPVNGDTVMSEMRTHDSALGGIVDAYNATSLINCRNTAIGTAIAHASVRKATGGNFITALDIFLP
ncbi:LPO_1073/Vpar_1526 family protein [Streptomyces sp. LARHCF252]